MLGKPPRPPRLRAIRRRAMIPAAMTLGWGCAVLQQLSFEEPSVELAAVRVTGVTLGGGALEVALRVHNPNPYRITGSQFDGELLLEDTRFGTVAREAPWALPAQADTTLALQLGFAWSAVGAAARSLLDRGSVAYTLTGRMLVGIPTDDRWIRISHRGEVPLERVLR